MASEVTPHIKDGHAPLAELINRALRRFGEFNPSTIDADLSLMMLEFANQVIEDTRAHPYWQGGRVPYYTSIHESRPIPDEIMISGLLVYYSGQQHSSKTELYLPLYTQRLNTVLWERMNGNAPIELTAPDGGTSSWNRKHTRRNKGRRE